MLTVNINNLEVECIIGILEEERKKPQKVIVDISFKYFYQKKEKKFIDYNEVINLVTKILVEKNFELIEDAILYIKKALKSNFYIKDLDLKITKPDAIPNAIVSIQKCPKSLD